jgi:YidC/Oxa1 family membrane protein insertase
VESRLALAMALSLGILVGFQFLFPQKSSDPRPGESAQTATLDGQAPPVVAGDPSIAPATQPGTAPAAPDAANVEPGTPVDVRTSLYRVRIQPRGGRLTSYELTKYNKSPEPGSGPYDLIHAGAAAPLALLWRTEAGTVVDDRSVAYEVTAAPAEPRPGEPTVVTMRGRTSSGATITKTLKIPADSYLLDYEVRTEGLPATPLAVGWSREINPNKSSSDIEGAVGYFAGALHPFDAGTLEETEVVEGQASWAGYAEHYFLAAYVPRQREPLKLVASASEGSGHSTLWTEGNVTSLDYGLYVGPKSFDELEKAGHDLVQAVDLGWFWFVAKPLLVALLWIERVVGNYGWAIVLLTIAVRLAFYPVNKKQIEAMKGMQAIQPEVKKLQERYADDREKMNVEMMELYRRHKVNPLAGCLPMLVQLPVFIGLYNVLLQSIELRHAPFFGWMHDLSQPDRLGSLAIPFVEPAGIPVMTLLMGATMVIQQKMTPSTMDPQQQRIMMIMPVVFTVMFVNFPAGLVLYWLSNNVLSIGQQWLSDRQA